MLYCLEFGSTGDKINSLMTIQLIMDITTTESSPVISIYPVINLIPYHRNFKLYALRSFRALKFFMLYLMFFCLGCHARFQPILSLVFSFSQ